MKTKEAVLKTLKELNKPSLTREVFEHIMENNYTTFTSKTPEASVAAIMGNFIRDNDVRVKRFKNDVGVYLYYLPELEGLDFQQPKAKKSNPSYKERDLHKLLSTFLSKKNTQTKTIFHEKSNTKDENQKWVHPDMAGVEFDSIQSGVYKKLKGRSFKLKSYEIKREIGTDGELKKAFSQAVSNSGLANYGYLVVYEIGDNLLNELERLCNLSGIGVIELNTNPYESRVLFRARENELDDPTIDKLCTINKDFEEFISLIADVVHCGERYYDLAQQALNDFCDEYFETDEEIEKYCKEKLIPNKGEDNV